MSVEKGRRGADNKKNDDEDKNQTNKHTKKKLPY